VTEPAPFSLDAALGRAYGRSVGVSQGSVDDSAAEFAAALAGGDVSNGALQARLDALAAVERRCAVSKVQAAFLRRVLGI
jgi:hypothetical protein